MQSLAKIAATLGVVGAIAVGSTAPAAPGTVTIIATTTTVAADGEPGMDAHRIGPFRVASASHIDMVRGTCTALVTATGVN